MRHIVETDYWAENVMNEKQEAIGSGCMKLLSEGGRATAENSFWGGKGKEAKMMMVEQSKPAESCRKITQTTLMLIGIPLDALASSYEITS